MKKTLLIAAAALAAGVISSEAQVYSQNVVGYINQVIPAGGYQLIGNQLINGSDANATNGDVNATLINGLVSSPNDPPNLSSNSVMYAWNGSGFAAYYYFNSADATTWENSGGSSPVYPAGWYDGAGTPASISLAGSKSCFIQNHSSAPITVTTVGTVVQGTNSITIASGYNLITLQQPISTNPASATFGLPGNLNSSPVDPPALSRNDTLFSWNGSGYAAYYYFNSADATTWENSGGSSPVYPAGFYDGAGTPMPDTSYPQVNQGFFLYHSGAPITWTTTFSVQ